MFAREHLSIVTRWARDRLRNGVETAPTRAQLRQLIEAADALRAQLPAAETPSDILVLDDFRRSRRHA
jgi:hypothetical protein